MPIQTAIDSISNNQGSPFGFKNRIINGAMVIDQRNAGAEVSPAVNNSYYIDRWQAVSTVASKYKIGQNAGTVTPPTGYINYLGLTSLSAYTVGASEAYSVRQKIEGFNIADLAWGTASAATVTLSFWVRSSLTGTFGGALKNSASDRTYPYSYTISSANTWEQKTVTIAGDTSGTWLTTNGIGIQVFFAIGAGATTSGPAGAWSSTNYNSATGATSVVGTNGATFYITGVQLEKGRQATEFDYRDYGNELRLCQRYYEHSYNSPTNSGQTGMIVTSVWSAVSNAYIPVQFKVTKCGQPAMVAYDTSNNVGKITTPTGANQTFFAFERVGQSSVQLTTNSISGIGSVWFGWSADAEL
jgi:hypothetical protein